MDGPLYRALRTSNADATFRDRGVPVSIREVPLSEVPLVRLVTRPFSRGGLLRKQPRKTISPSL